MPLFCILTLELCSMLYALPLSSLSVLSFPISPRLSVFLHHANRDKYKYTFMIHLYICREWVNARGSPPLLSTFYFLTPYDTQSDVYEFFQTESLMLLPCRSWGYRQMLLFAGFYVRVSDPILGHHYYLASILHTESTFQPHSPDQPYIYMVLYIYIYKQYCICNT